MRCQSSAAPPTPFSIAPAMVFICAKSPPIAAVRAEVSAMAKFAFGSVISPVTGSTVMPAR